MDRDALLRHWQKNFFLPDSKTPTKETIITQVMDVGEDNHFRELEANFSREELIAVLQAAPPLSFRPRSWEFWHFRLGTITMMAELPNPPRWDINTKAPEDMRLLAITPERVQAAIEWLALINQVNVPPASPADLAAYLVDDDQHRGDPVHELAFALKDAGVLSKKAMGSLLARYVKYCYFRRSQTKTKPPALHDLLAQCDPEQSLDAESQAWLNSPPVGLEIIDAPPLPTLALEEFIQQLRAQPLPEQSLEICDLANAIGVVLGNNVDDKQSLLRDFKAGFRHGISLTYTGNRPDWLSFQSVGQENEPT